MSAFTEAFLVDFFQSIHKIEKDNWDHSRFAEDHPRANNFMVDNAVRWMYAIMKNLEQYERAFELLEDDYSKALMVKLLEYDVLDHHHVRLPQNTPTYWEAYHSVDEKYLAEKGVYEYYGRVQNLYKIPELDLTICGNPSMVLGHFILKQYYYRRGPFIQPEAGDICIDAGSCGGEVALQFAQSVGETGFVYGFEFVQDNLELLAKNLALNPEQASRIKIIQQPVWQASNQALTFNDRGPSTHVASQIKGDGQLTVLTKSIDDLVKEEGIPKVDFIKMDIEGAEASALIGARETIQQFKPKLAICVYHKKDDFYTIPALINQIFPGYAFYLDHYTIHREETVLYATPKSEQPG